MNVLLIILDGFGLGKEYPGNAYFLAKKPHFEEFFQKYPWVKLKAAGNAVGVPEGTQGGSEVGHFTIGAGRIVWQTLESINRSIRDKSFFEKKVFLEACKTVREKRTALHLIGMISDQGVHSHLDHLFALLELAKREKVARVFLHAILDGRDVPEKSASEFLKRILKKIHELGLEENVTIATIIGRYFAMDRDMNWSRTEKAYNLYTLGEGREEKDPLQAIQNAYASGVESDYYVEPIILNKHGIIKDKDAVIHWNFRTDRNRELTWAFTGEREIGFTPKKIVRPFFVCMGPYSEQVAVAFPTPSIKNNLSAVLASHDMPQLRIAETEKYAHVTYFLNSQIEKPFSLEDQILIDSPKTPSYADKPEMSAYEVTNRLIKEIEKQKYKFIAVNFANCDLVGHSGVLKAAVRAVEVIDECLGKILPVAQKNGYAVIITGDHGNVEYMLYDENPPTGKTPGKLGESCPSHTTNPVPFILISNGATVKNMTNRNPELQDIAPTILDLLNIKQPEEMTGVSLA